MIKKAFIVVVLLAGLWVVVEMNISPKEEVVTTDSLTLSTETSLLTTTVWVAEHEGYFEKYGLNLTIKEYDSGRNALDAMLESPDIHMSTVAQTPIVFKSGLKGEFKIIASMAYSLDDVKLLALKSSGIKTPGDLAGKKIGFTRRSTGHYFLEGLLTHYGLSLENIVPIDVNASELRSEFAAGRIDAMTTWEPHIYNAKKSLGADKIISMISPTTFRKDFFFTTRTDLNESQRRAQIKFMKAIVDAEEFIENNTEASKKIIVKRLKMDPIIVETVWDNFTYQVALDQVALVTLDNETRWAIEHGYVNSGLPNYLDFIDFEPMEAVKPAGINIIY